jgi:hypothetical protein
MLGSSYPNGYRDGAGARAESGAVSSGCGLYVFLSFCSGLSCSLYLSAEMKGDGGGAQPSSRLTESEIVYSVLTDTEDSV